MEMVKSDLFYCSPRDAWVYEITDIGQNGAAHPFALLGTATSGLLI